MAREFILRQGRKRNHSRPRAAEALAEAQATMRLSNVGCVYIVREIGGILYLKWYKLQKGNSKDNDCV